MDHATLASVIRVVLDGASRLLPLDPDTTTLLLRHYVRTGDAEARQLVETGLAVAVAGIGAARDPWLRLAWLRTLDEAAGYAVDPSLAAHVHQALPDAVDALEAAVRHLYEPGEGLVDRPCAEQVRASAVLLSAFELTGRLPYAMLAEELLQGSRRRWWRPGGHFEADLAVNCTAALVHGQLAALHEDPDYRAAAVITPGQAYRTDVRTLLAFAATHGATDSASAATYGLALLEWFALEPNLQ